jgi:hypothetical protein
MGSSEIGGISGYRDIGISGYRDIGMLYRTDWLTGCIQPVSQSLGKQLIHRNTNDTTIKNILFKRNCSQINE